MVKIGLVYLVLVAGLYLLAFGRDRQRIGLALKNGGGALVNLLPFLLAIFALVGLAQEFLPAELIEKLLGQQNRGLALLLGGLAGAISVGPPLAAYPIAGTLVDNGAWPPAVAAFILSWVSVGIVTLPFEAKIFSWRFALVRNGLTLLTAMLSGLLLGGLL
jgi:uncharacterized membrane protein YraQ (UPF0718 family)